jgi:phosphoserine aminotransferase
MAAAIPGANQKTRCADKNYYTQGFVAQRRQLGVIAHVEENTARPGGSAIDSRNTRHKGYAKSIHARRGIEKVFDWMKKRGGLRRFRLRETEKVSDVFGLHVIA